MAEIFSAPKRVMSEPVKKLGTNMASACHWMTQLESFTEKPQPSMATGVAVITSTMMPKASMAVIAATM